MPAAEVAAVPDHTIKRRARAADRAAAGRARAKVHAGEDAAHEPVGRVHAAEIEARWLICCQDAVSGEHEAPKDAPPERPLFPAHGASAQQARALHWNAMQLLAYLMLPHTSHPPPISKMPATTNTPTCAHKRQRPRDPAVRGRGDRGALQSHRLQQHER